MSTSPILEERHSQQLVGEFEGDQICLHRSCKFVFYCLVSSAISIRIILFGQHLRHEVESKKKETKETLDQDRQPASQPASLA